ncbi:OmpA family protein [Amaricoccus tamworthensis]|uniref:OmpA family protein n=2 Tax=Pukyongiella litopenaei TaxID=2605946 RepID=A0A2S0MVX5_9RHOB|nr:OmpA family protein [Pukyongiella litopenaei]
MRFLAVVSSVIFLFSAGVTWSQALGEVNFSFDSSVLSGEALEQVQSIALQLKSSGSYKQTVLIGHTDAVGGAGYNQSLGLRRAEAVRNALIAAGVPASRIGTVASRGKNELLVSVAGPELRNRRVSVSLDDIMGACRSWRDVGLTTESVGGALQQDLATRLQEATQTYSRLSGSGRNGSAYQMAGAAREDCDVAVGYRADTVRKLEYAKRCFCNYARMKVAVGD